jgi:hypothetical protein
MLSVHALIGKMGCERDGRTVEKYLLCYKRCDSYALELNMNVKVKMKPNEW